MHRARSSPLEAVVNVQVAWPAAAAGALLVGIGGIGYWRVLREAATIIVRIHSLAAGLGALLTPANCVLLLIDHQPFQFAGLRSHDTQTIINNVVGLAKSAKLFGVPTLLTTVLERQGGYLLKPLQDVFPEQKPIDRTFINTWEDPRVVDWVKQSGRMKIVMQQFPANH